MTNVVVPATAKKPTNGTAQIIKENPALFSMFKVGDVVEGKVLEKSSRMLLVDLGRYGTGAVYRGELQNAKGVVKSLKEGDQIHGKVIEVDNEDGYIELSLSEASKQKSWIQVAELKEKEEVFVVKPITFNRGGLVGEVCGIQAFIPTSQLASEHYPHVTSPNEEGQQIKSALEKLIGVEISVKIIDVNPRTNKLILSEKEAVQVSSKELAKNYAVGQTIEGIVSGVADFGAFVRFTDNPAVEGLVHVSELDYRIVENPKEVINVDDAVKAKIIDIKEGKIALSIKALKPNPWDEVNNYYTEGKEVLGEVYSFNPFGAMINLDHGLQGQIHVSEFGSVEEMKKRLQLKGKHEFTIESIKPADKRIILKLKK